MDVTSVAGTAYPSGVHEFSPGFSGVRVTRSIFSFMCMFCRSLNVNVIDVFNMEVNQR
jgi:hypothetical protein